MSYLEVKHIHGYDNPSINRTVESGFPLRSTPLSTAGYFIVKKYTKSLPKMTHLRESFNMLYKDISTLYA